MKYWIKMVYPKGALHSYPNGLTCYLSIRGRTAWSMRHCRRILRDWVHYPNGPTLTIEPD